MGVGRVSPSLHLYSCMPTLWLHSQTTENKHGYELCMHMMCLKIVEATAVLGKQGNFSFKAERIVTTSRNRLLHFLKQVSTRFTASGVAAVPPGAAPTGAESDTCSLWGKPALHWPHGAAALQSRPCHTYASARFMLTRLMSSEHSGCSIRVLEWSCLLWYWPGFWGCFGGCKTGDVAGKQLSIPTHLKTWMYFSIVPAGSANCRWCGPSSPPKLEGEVVSTQLLSLPNINFPKPHQDPKEFC